MRSIEDCLDKSITVVDTNAFNLVGPSILRDIERGGLDAILGTSPHSIEKMIERVRSISNHINHPNFYVVPQVCLEIDSAAEKAQMCYGRLAGSKVPDSSRLTDNLKLLHSYKEVLENTFLQLFQKASENKPSPEQERVHSAIVRFGEAVCEDIDNQEIRLRIRRNMKPISYGSTLKTDYYLIASAMDIALKSRCIVFSDDERLYLRARRILHRAIETRQDEFPLPLREIEFVAPSNPYWTQNYHTPRILSPCSTQRESLVDKSTITSN